MDIIIKINEFLDEGRTYSCLAMVATVVVMVMAASDSVAALLYYSIVYLVNYHWCSYLELKKALFVRAFFSAMGLLYLLYCLFY